MSVVARGLGRGEQRVFVAWGLGLNLPSTPRPPLHFHGAVVAMEAGRDTATLDDRKRRKRRRRQEEELLLLAMGMTWH